MAIRIALACSLLFCALPADPAAAFALFGFRNAAEVAAGNYRRWDLSQSVCGPDDRHPFDFTFAIDDEFMAGEDAPTLADARPAVLRAFESWSQATGGLLQFREAAWDAVQNQDPVPPCWEGPGFDEWLTDPAFWQAQGFNPGWGANIEVFTIPTGTTIVSQGQSKTMTASNLGFAIINWLGDNILSVDIYLNADKNWRSGGGTGAWDVETVVVHEIGHALGLDHPDQAGGCFPDVGCNDGDNFDPITFEPGAEASPQDLMYSQYTGVKRDLTEDEFGGLALLYPPTDGDFNGDEQVTTIDVAQAISLVEGPGPNAYQLFAGDFFNRNRRIDVAELTQLLLWATGEAPYAPESAGRTDMALPSSAPTTINIIATPSAQDVGKGDPVTIALDVLNPNSVLVLAWELELSYHQSAFTPATCFDGDFPPQGLKIDDLEDDGRIFLSKFGVNGSTAGAGTLAEVEFDVDIDEAVDASDLSFNIESISVIANIGGVLVEFGMTPDQNLVIESTGVEASDFDASGDGAVDLGDVYAWHADPSDVDRDGAIDDADRRALVDCLRSGEPADMLSDPG